jgi:hypothetical protein
MRMKIDARAGILISAIDLEFAQYRHQLHKFSLRILKLRKLWPSEPTTTRKFYGEIGTEGRLQRTSKSGILLVFHSKRLAKPGIS